MKKQAMVNRAHYLMLTYPPIISILLVACVAYLYFLYSNLWVNFKGVHIPPELNRFFFSFAQLYLQLFMPVFLGLSMVINFIAYNATNGLINNFYFLPLGCKHTLVNMSFFYAVVSLATLTPWLVTYVITLSGHLHVALLFSLLLFLSYFAHVFFNLNIAVLLSRVISMVKKVVPALDNAYIFFSAILLAGLGTYGLHKFNFYIVNTGSLYILLAVMMAAAGILTAFMDFKLVNQIRTVTRSKVVMTDVWAARLPLYSRLGIITIGRNFKAYTLYLLTMGIALAFFVSAQVTVTNRDLVTFSAPLIVFSSGIKGSFSSQLTRLPIKTWAWNFWDILESLPFVLMTYFLSILIIDMPISIDNLASLLIVSNLLFILQKIIKLPLKADDETGVIFFVFYSVVAMVIMVSIARLTEIMSVAVILSLSIALLLPFIWRR